MQPWSTLSAGFVLLLLVLIYTHNHADHIADGEVFADTALVVAHENAKTAIVHERRPTAVPQVTFSERLSLELGGTVVRHRRGN
jgi:glyoxylase-like metal-dependent hydrolase (beta-lactamase superfamily II)